MDDVQNAHNMKTVNAALVYHNKTMCPGHVSVFGPIKRRLSTSSTQPFPVVLIWTFRAGLYIYRVQIMAF